MALTKVPLSLLDSPGASGNVLTSDGTNWTSSAPAGVPTGAIIYWPSATVPSGYLQCDGSIYNRSSYSTLSTVIGSPMLPSSETLRNSAITIGSSFTGANYITSVNNIIFTAGSVGYSTASQANAFRTSTDGITFTLRTGAPFYTQQGSVAYFASTYVTLVSMTNYFSSTCLYQTSTDLATWTQRSFTAGTNAGYQLALAGNQTWGRGIMHTATGVSDGCGGYGPTNPYYWYYSTNGTTWTAAASPPTNTQAFQANMVVAGSNGALAVYAPSNSALNAVWYTADGSTYSNITSNLTSSFSGLTTFYKVVWTGTYYYLFCNSGILLRSTTGASGSWSRATNTLGLGATTNVNPYLNFYSDSYVYTTDGTYHLISNGTGAFWYSSDFANWGYISYRSGFYGAVTGSTFVGRSGGSTSNTYTMTGTGYTTATQFPVPNLTLGSAGAAGTFAPPPIPIIKT